LSIATPPFAGWVYATTSQVSVSIKLRVNYAVLFFKGRWILIIIITDRRVLYSAFQLNGR